MCVCPLLAAVLSPIVCVGARALEYCQCAYLLGDHLRSACATCTFVLWVCRASHLSWDGLCPLRTRVGSGVCSGL